MFNLSFIVSVQLLDIIRTSIQHLSHVKVVHSRFLYAYYSGASLSLGLNKVRTCSTEQKNLLTRRKLYFPFDDFMSNAFMESLHDATDISIVHATTWDKLTVIKCQHSPQM